MKEWLKKMNSVGWILPAFVVQYSSTQKSALDSACGVVRHTDAGPVRWSRCEPGQVGNQAALSGVLCAFQTACIRMPSYAGRGQNPVMRCPFLLPILSGKGSAAHVSSPVPQVETPAV
jgi:hypothetical protein